MGNSAVSKDHLKVDHIAGRPAILRAEEAQSTCQCQTTFIQLLLGQQTSKHISPNTNTSHTSTNNRPTSPFQAIMRLLPGKTWSNVRRLVLLVIDNLVQILG